MSSYQGSKRQYATQIINLIRRECPRYQQLPFYDLCCGAGYISSAWPFRNYMVDIGSWGKFWELYCQNRNEVDCYFADMIPRLENSNVAEYCKRLIQSAVPDDYTFCFDFLILQANMFQGKPIKDEVRWRTPGFEPTITLQKMLNLWTRIKRTLIRDAYQLDVNTMNIKEEAIIYMDPDYKNTTGYWGDTVRVQDFVNRHRHCHIFVSEAQDISGVPWTRIEKLNETHVSRSNGGQERVHILKP